MKAEGKKPKKCHLKREISELRKKQNFQIKNKSTKDLPMMSVHNPCAGESLTLIIDNNHILVTTAGFTSYSVLVFIHLFFWGILQTACQ